MEIREFEQALVAPTPMNESCIDLDAGEIEFQVVGSLRKSVSGVVHVSPLHGMLRRRERLSPHVSNTTLALKRATDGEPLTMTMRPLRSGS